MMLSKNGLALFGTMFLLPYFAITGCAEPLKVALIPVKYQTLLPFLERVKPAQDKLPSTLPTRSMHLSFVDPSYTVEFSPDTAIDINPFTGDISNAFFLRTDDVSRKEDVEDRIRRALAPEVLEKKAWEYARKLFPEAGKLQLSGTDVRPLDPDDIFPRTSFAFNEYSPEGARTLNSCGVRLWRHTGQISHFRSRYRKTEVSLKPAWKKEDALSLARWAITGGNQVKVQVLLLGSEFNEEQRKAWAGEFKGHKDVELYVEEDPWFHQRLVWQFNFNVGNVYLEAHTGQVLSTSPWPVPSTEFNWKPFELDKPAAVAKPARMPPTPAPMDGARVNFNGEEMQKGVTELHYPPIIRDGACLIFSEYFPKFLITVERKGDAITLQGQLKDKGKSATLKIGAKQATVDGKEVTLASAPVVIDNRLYLPAELLQLTNGIPVRWEPKNKLLWVETRYLRR